ncbi:MAG TPA: C25 family cysteine peptidase [Candidatus Thermoplasmatota archaeon]|nr:C25 family cysteine peptidase [Candidatus Thermoplasmatota archaeon]
MKKIIPLLLIGIMVLSGLGAATVTNTSETTMKKTQTISFSNPEIIEKEGYAFVTMQETNTWLKAPDAPMLPAFTTTYTFPFGTKIKTVDVTFSEAEEYVVEQKIAPTPTPVTYVAGKKVKYHQEAQAMGSTYPETLYDYHLGAGISGEDHVIFVTVRCFPIQYKSEGNTILFRDKASLSITYVPPSPETSMVDEYSLVIIAPKTFSESLQPLVNHKTSKGITTKLVTRNEICDSVYFPAEGRDCAEEMKYFIKNAYDQWGTDYVLLVGGRYGGILKEKWYVPVRYTNLDDGANWEGGFLSDLYFADLYDAYGNFSTWDSNGNGIFAEWNSQGKDILDMYPEVYIGRLACTNLDEVKTLVTKITTYENTTAGSEWFNKMVVVGGDSAPNATDPWYEGEEENALALQYLAGFDGIRLWTSNGNFTKTQDVIDGINAGCGFLFFDGHGNPMSWSTHPPHNESMWITGLQVKDMPKLTNAEKLPVTVCGGCHNGQFNTSLLNILKGVIQEGLKYFQWKFYLGEWTPECWAWKLMSVKNGGSIATMAYTGLDWFATEDWNNDTIPDCTQFYSGYANTQFFKNYGVNNMTILGQAHTQTLIDYLNAYPPMLEKLDAKTVQEFVLLGDPSLQIGGYS